MEYAFVTEIYQNEAVINPVWAEDTTPLRVPIALFAEVLAHWLMMLERHRIP